MSNAACNINAKLNVLVGYNPPYPILKLWGLLSCTTEMTKWCDVQYVPLGPAVRAKRSVKAESAAFKPPHSCSSGTLGRYEYIPCPAIKQVSVLACPAASDHFCMNTPLCVVIFRRNSA